MTAIPRDEIGGAIRNDKIALPYDHGVGAFGHQPSAAGPIAGARNSTSRFLDAVWYRRSVRAQLLITFVLINFLAALLGGLITIMQAVKSTQVEVAASMKMAEVLVGETIQLVQQELPAEQFLADLPVRLRLVRHVRISVRDANGHPVEYGRGVSAPARDVDHAEPPAWFAGLIAPPVETREIPVLIKGQRIGSVVVVGAPSDEIAEVWENTIALAAAAGVVSLGVIGILYVLFGHVLDPLKGLGAGLLDLERRKYQVRLPRPKALELAVITDRFNALAEALDAVRSENTRLNQRLITAQDDERSRMALDLHDEVGPCLFGLRANATSIANIRDGQQDSGLRLARDRAGDMLGIIDHLQAINRSLLKRLRPMALGHIPLGDLLSALVRDRARQHPDVSFLFSADELRRGYGDSIDLTIYRCVQESLTNAIRHANARQVITELRQVQPAGEKAEPERSMQLSLIVCDDGCGIGADASEGLGIQGMQERVQALGGDFQIESRRGEGTTVRIKIPITGA
jgi:two-component system sensor histidine kinase UhpB